jgi:SAM-dependent methyltransferase
MTTSYTDFSQMPSHKLMNGENRDVALHLSRSLTTFTQGILHQQKRRYQMAERIYTIGAKYYDGAYQNNPNLHDVPFYLDLAQRYGGPILEIACGTGRILLEVARKGIEIWGVDSSREQLAILTSKLEKEPESVRSLVKLFEDDMRTFVLDRKFRLVTIPFRPMQHMLTVDDQISALNAARSHLMPGGFLAFDVFFPDYSLLLQPSDKEILDVEWRDPGNDGQVVRRYFRRTSVDLLQQHFGGEFIFRTFENDRVIQEERSQFTMSYYTYPQLLLLFRQCRLEIAGQYGGFTGEPINVCKEMVFLLRPAT